MIEWMSAVAMPEGMSRSLMSYRIRLDMACRVGIAVVVIRHYARGTALLSYSLEPEVEVDSWYWYRKASIASCKGRNQLAEQGRQDQERCEPVDNPVDWLPLPIDPRSGSESCRLKEVGMVDWVGKC
jgi:hypothetical protein